MMKLAYDGWLKLYTTEYEGRTYEVLDNHDAVAAIVMDLEKKILLVEQFRLALNANTLELPAGVVDKPCLSLKEIMAEELMEEAQLAIDHHELKEIMRFKPIVGFSQSEMILFSLFLPAVFKSQAVSDQDVFYAHWLPFEIFEQKVLSGQINDSKTVMAYYYLKSHESNWSL